MTSLLVKDLSRSDALDCEELLAVRGGIMMMERPPEQGPQPVDICGGNGSSSAPRWPSMPSMPSMPSLPTFPGPSGWWPCAPAGPAVCPQAAQ